MAANWYELLRPLVNADPFEQFTIVLYGERELKVVERGQVRLIDIEVDHFEYIFGQSSTEERVELVAFSAVHGLRVKRLRRS